MSILLRNRRDMVAFEVENPDHRKWFAEFVKYRSWGQCPVRFMTDALDQDLVSFINEKMLAYYIKREFENEKGSTKTRGTASKSKTSSRTVRRTQPVQA